MYKTTAIVSIMLVACGPDSRVLGPHAGSRSLPVAMRAPTAPSVSREAGVEPVATFDRDAGQRPEGIAIGPHGEIYVAMARLAEVWELDRAGGHTILATLVPELPARVPGVLGLAAGEDGSVYAALASVNPATRGVYRISAAGVPTRLDGSERISFPNAIAIGESGDLFITDTCVGLAPGCPGAVWRYREGEGTSLWSSDALLAGTGVLGPIAGTPVPLGANGIAYWRRGLYLANTEQGSVVRIPIRSDGSAGDARLLVRDPALLTVDGITVDARGDVYAMVLGRDRIVQIDRRTGALATVADAADGLDQPVNAAFGTTRGDRHELYVTDYALYDFDLTFPTGRPDRPGAGVVRTWRAVPGR